MKRNIWENLNGDRSFSCRLCSDINNGRVPGSRLGVHLKCYFPSLGKSLDLRSCICITPPATPTLTHCTEGRGVRVSDSRTCWPGAQGKCLPQQAWASTPPLSSPPPAGAARGRHHQVPPTQGTTLGLENLQENSHHRSTGLRAAGTPWTVPGTEVQQSLQSLPG